LHCILVSIVVSPIPIIAKKATKNPFGVANLKEDTRVTACAAAEMKMKIVAPVGSEIF
jgi:hypothetical protein